MRVKLHNMFAVIHTIFEIVSILHPVMSISYCVCLTATRRLLAL